ncbi:aldehyde dehydrogenase family protein [Leucobacter muris]|uniref:Aldehyde dehydrogenase family protein n=1 Tax=Leucobacter muris TaxID=1935379 RepID=A0ABX5QHX3_9MICO|nr:aldehyde dehydrogenase family protein [Leucobacter muris]QAB18692.1 aldehyde dehydrogenase family protein [Leucobacter muris]
MTTEGTNTDPHTNADPGTRSNPGAGEGIAITDPHDGTPVGTVPVTAESGIREAVARARRAFPAWRATPAAERGAALRRAAHALGEREGDLADLNHRETGRDREEAAGGVRAAVDTLLQYAELAPLHRGRSLLGANEALDLMRAEPRGVAALVTPWNDPVAVSAGLIGAALGVGNTVVHKPSERCPHLGRLLGEVLEPHFPSGVIATVIGGSREGEMLVGSPDVDVVAHVGSTLAGERIARIVALTGAHLIRENGGNDALIVDADVDPRWAAAQAAVGAFSNSGQICTAVERIFVHRDIADEFLAALTEEASDRTERGVVAPLVDERMRETVHAHVADAVASGARVLTGGELPQGAGSRYPATVLSDCAPSMRIFSEETFGPVAAVMTVDGFAEAVESAAHDDYGLAATVLTADLAHAHHAIDALPVGTVKVNAVFGGAPGGSAQPRGRSGSGFGYGPELLDEMTTVKVVHLGAAVRR